MHHPLAFRFCRVVLLLLLPCVAGSAQAAITTLRLTTDYSDFCIHPVSGDVAAISLTDDHIHLFRSADLAAGKKEPAAKLRVGSTPCGICFKRYEQLELFAVVCEKDSYLYLIDAKTGTLHRKVELPDSHTLYISSSLDPHDPLLFFHCRGSQEVSGVVSLKDYKAQNVEYLEGSVTAVSASRSTAYLNSRNHGQGHTAVSLARDSTFLETHSIHENKIRLREILPDPFDRFVAVSSLIYTRNFEKREAELNFTPLCFLSKKPLLFGVDQDWPRVEQEKSSVVLKAASFNTFSATGQPVVLEPGDMYPPLPKRNAKGKQDPAIAALYSDELPRGVLELDSNHEKITYKLRILADEPRERLIVAYRGRLDFVPLAEFQTPLEPLLLAKLQGETTAYAGRAWTGTLELSDPTAEFVFSELPEGMKAAGTKLQWTPNSTQIGTQKLGVTLKHKDIQRLLSFEIEVFYPSLALPFEPTSIGISPNGALALLSNCSLSRWQRQRGDRERPDQPVVMLLDLKTEKVLATKKLGEAMRLGALTNNLVAMIHEVNPERCEILDAKTLARTKTLAAESPIQAVQPYGKLLLLNTELGLEFYDSANLQLVKRFNLRDEFRGHDVVPYDISATGLRVWGMRYDLDLKPLLLEKNYHFASFDKPDNVSQREMELFAMSQRRMLQDSDHEMRHDFNQRNRPVAKASRDTSDGVIVDALLTEIRPVERGFRETRQLLELSLAARGQAAATQLLARNSIALNRAGDHEDVLLELSATNEAFVSHNARLYRWQVPKAAPEQPTADNVARPIEMVPQQSAFQLGGTAQTVLKHEARHGQKPYRFTLTQARAGMTIDEKTGVVTLDDKKLLADAVAKIESDYRGEDHFRQHGNDDLQQAAEQRNVYATQILGIKPKGFSWVIPVEVTVQDAQNQESALRYYVMADVPLEPLLEKFKKIDEAKKAEYAEAAKAERALRQPGPAAPELQTLLKRIESLEQRLDLNTRQLNQVLKLLEEKNNSK